MNFDEKYFSNLLLGISNTQNSILQISNYMIYFYNNYERIIEIWKQNFKSGINTEAQLYFIYLANDVISKTTYRGKLEYLKGFGDIFTDIFTSFEGCQNKEIIKSLIKTLDLWENRMIYSKNFLDILRKILSNENSQQNDVEMINENENTIKETNEKENSINKKNHKFMSDLKIISKFDMCKTNFELDIEEENIKSMNMKVDREKIKNLIENINNGKEANRDELKDIEEKLKDLRKLIVIDIGKRENYMLSISDFIHKEKKNYVKCLNETSTNNENINGKKEQIS